MNICVIIPAHNEEAYLKETLQSLVQQTLLPQHLVVVNDGSTDGTQAIIDKFEENYDFITSVILTSEDKHIPGSKIINAFYKGVAKANKDWDMVCKFDADLKFPKNYLEEIVKAFQHNKKLGIAGGHCYINENDAWKLENLTSPKHVRGALKSYSKECFEAIGGLKKTMGWDTIDELLAQYHGFEVDTLPYLKVQHNKPTGENYLTIAGTKQGEAFYKMRYGWLLTSIATLKLALKKKNFAYFIQALKGYKIAKKTKVKFEVSEAEGKFIRNLRWRGIKNKLF